MEENNYFLSWQLPSMSLSWLCIIPAGCSVASFRRSEKRMVLVDMKKSRSLTEAAWMSTFGNDKLWNLFLHSHLQSPCYAFKVLIFQAAPSGVCFLGSFQLLACTRRCSAWGEALRQHEAARTSGGNYSVSMRLYINPLAKNLLN